MSSFPVWTVLRGGDSDSKSRVTSPTPTPSNLSVLSSKGFTVVTFNRSSFTDEPIVIPEDPSGGWPHHHSKWHFDEWSTVRYPYFSFRSLSPFIPGNRTSYGSHMSRLLSIVSRSTDFSLRITRVEVVMILTVSFHINLILCSSPTDRMYDFVLLYVLQFLFIFLKTFFFVFFSVKSTGVQDGIRTLKL